MPNTCYTYFTIIGHFDPDIITARLLLQPYDAGKDHWHFGKCDEYSPYVEEQMRKTIAPLLDKIDILKQIRQEFNAVFFLEIVPTIYPDEPMPCLAPSLDVIDFCHETRTEIDIDLYGSRLTMSKTKERIRDSQLRYKQGLGQNFIYDEDLLASLVEAAGVTKEDDVLEVGPGAGSMTKHLCHAAHHVLSIELDDRLIPLLTAFMNEFDNFTLVHGDVMTVNLPEITANLRKPLSVVANIPYYITTPLMTMLLTSPLDIKQMALMVQKEVADKVLAEPGTEAWGPLALRCQFYCDPYLAMDVPAECFTPVPKVDSAFIVLPKREKPLVQVKSEEDFFRVAQAGFALRRKTMTNGLCAAFHMERAEAAALMQAAGLDERIRGEKLGFEELARLSDAYTDWKEQRA